MNTRETRPINNGRDGGTRREWGKLESALTLVLALIFLVIYIPLMVAYWPWFPIATLLIGLVGVGAWGRMKWEHHTLDIAMKRNQAFGYRADSGRVIPFHDTEQGFGYILPDGSVSGYSHSMSGMPPFDPALLGMGMGEQEPRARYPKTFQEMLKGGYIAPGADLVVGFDQETGDAITLPNPTSTGMSGLPGAGKTVTTSLLLMEMIAKWNGRVRFLVVDPHMEVDGEESLLSKIEPLAPYFLSVGEVRTTVPADDQEYTDALKRLDDLPNPTAGGQELGVWMQIVYLEMQRRKHGKTGDVWVIVIDEFAAVMDGPQSKLISKVIASINREARKMGMYALVISQDWKASTAGGTDIRQSIPAFIIHNTAEPVVKLFAPADVARLAEGLDVGQVIVRTRGKSSTGKVPMVTEYDAQKLMELYPPVSRVQITEERNGTGQAKGKRSTQPLLAPVPVDGSFTEVSGRLVVADTPPDMVDGRPEVEHLEEIRDLFGDGWNAPDIAKRVYGVKSGPDLAEAKLKVDRAIRWVVANGR